MAQRIITAHVIDGTMEDLANGEYAEFLVDSDTGPVVGALIVAARLHISQYKSYSSSYALLVRYNSTSSIALAGTAAMSADESTHASTITLTNRQPGLLSLTPGNIFLEVSSSTTTNKINFRDGCTITLEIDYAHLSDYTDPEIIPGETPVRAVHITELQVNTAALREAYNCVDYTFTSIRAHYTSLADWTAHIMELREAIDGLGVDHEDWLEIAQNSPRADVLMQLRRVLAAIAASEGGNG